MATSPEQPRYEFGPLARPGVVAGLSGAQLLLLAGGLAVAVVTVRIHTSGLGFLASAAVVVTAVAAAFAPVGGRLVHEWVPVAAGWGLQRVRGRHRHRCATPRLGFVGGKARPDPPPAVAGVRLLAADVAGGQQVGVLHDSRAGTYTMVLAVRGRSFELADSDEKARRLQAWGDLLAGLGRSGSPVHRLQWIERTVPEDGDELGRYLASAVQVGTGHPSLASYLELLDAAGPASQPHEVFVAVSVSAHRARRAIKAAGGGQEGAMAVLVREVTHLQRDLAAAEVIVDGAVPPRMLARVLRTAYDPSARGHLSRRAAGDPDEAGTTEPNAWPAATETTWGAYRADGAWHATYWIGQWPRMPVGAEFLIYLLLGTTAIRTISLTMEPIPAARAHREVTNTLVQGLADDELRAKAGFLSSARRRREREAVAQREEELAAGHTDYRIAGFVTVTAADPEALEVACGEVEQAAERCRLELRRCYGEQDAAFTCTLPLARGLS